MTELLLGLGKDKKVLQYRPPNKRTNEREKAFAAEEEEESTIELDSKVVLSVCFKF